MASKNDSKVTIKTKNDAIESIGKLVDENKEAFKGIEVSLYGDYLDSSIKSASGDVGIVLEAKGDKGPTDKELNKVLSKFRDETNNRVTVYWVNILRKNEEDSIKFRERHGLKASTNSVYKRVMERKELIREAGGE